MSQRDLAQVQLGAACGSEALQQVGGHFGSDKEIALAFSHTDISNGLSADPGTHQSAQKVPVAGAVRLIKAGPQTNTGAVWIIQGIFFQIFRQIDQHFPLGIGIAAEGIQPRHIAKEIPGHFQLPGRQEAGVCRNAFPHTGGYFVPQLCQKKTILRRVGDFLNMISIHAITLSYCTIDFGF